MNARYATGFRNSASAVAAQSGLAAIRSGWGSFDAYLEGPLGVDARERARLQELLLASPEG
jgi:hypothetical protein